MYGYNINSGYGAHLAGALHGIRPTTGNVVVVGPETPALEAIRQSFRPDPLGKKRYFASIAAALASGDLMADRGDVVLVAPGHTEAVNSAGALTIAVAGISIIGLGEGSLRPTITVGGATSADINVDAANVTIENMILNLTGIDALVAPIDVNAAGFTLRGCKVITASASAQATLGILTDANAGGMQLLGNEFLGSADAGTATAVRIVGGNDHVIRGNVFIGNYTTSLGAIENNTTACLNVVVEGNFIYNRTASSTKAMVFAAGSTGIIANNMMQILSGSAPITGAAMSWVGGNYYAATIATAPVHMVSN